MYPTRLASCLPAQKGTPGDGDAVNTASCRYVKTGDDYKQAPGRLAVLSNGMLGALRPALAQAAAC